MQRRLTGGYTGYKEAVEAAYTEPMMNPCVRYSHDKGFFAESQLIPSNWDVVLVGVANYCAGSGEAWMTGSRSEYRQTRESILERMLPRLIQQRIDRARYHCQVGVTQLLGLTIEQSDLICEQAEDRILELGLEHIRPLLEDESYESIDEEKIDKAICKAIVPDWVKEDQKIVLTLKDDREIS
jgi:hypothetical protein